MPRPAQSTEVARWRAVSGVGGLVLVLLTLHGLDHPQLVLPDLGEPGTWSGVAGAVTPVGLLMSMVRLAAIGMCWYLLLAAALQVAASMTGGRLARLAERVLSPRTREVLAAVLGTGLLASAAPPVSTVSTVVTSHPSSTPREVDVSSTPPVPVAADHATSKAPRLSRVDDGSVRPDDTGEVLRLRRVDRAPSAPAMVRLDEDGSAHPPEPPPDDATPDQAERRWTVTAGDHFWHVAEEEVARTVDRPTERQVRTYWRRLVELNRDRLVDRGNPDLLLPGQVLVLPGSDDAGARR